MGYEAVLYGVERGVATITLNWPKLNAISETLAAEVQEALRAADADEEAGCAIVLTGAGNGFCSA